jgi:hypothetical protein
MTFNLIMVPCSQVGGHPEKVSSPLRFRHACGAETLRVSLPAAERSEGKNRLAKKRRSMASAKKSSGKIGKTGVGLSCVFLAKAEFG